MDIQQILKSAGKLSPSLEVLPKLLKLLGDSDSSLGDIIALIKLDPTLTAEIIRVSNSSFYGTTNKCNSIDLAVNRIGFVDVNKIVGALVGAKIFDSDYSLHKLKSHEMWAKSVKSGVIMHALSPRFGFNPDVMYTIGLLHSVGIVAINQYHKNVGITGYSEKKYPASLTAEDEKQLLGCNFAEVGAKLLEQMKFPAEIFQPIHYQANPIKSMSCATASSLMYLVSATIDHLANNTKEEDIYSAFKPDEIVLDNLGIKVEALIDAAIESESTFEWLANSI
jgi:HD-like signal output (HDOD) protein